MTVAARASEPPVEFTASTAGPPGDHAMTLIAHVLITMRWNRSRWVPSAWATAALIGSAWETHTIVPPGWAARRRSSVDTMRCCISEKLSPPGKRNVDGDRWTVCHSGFFISFYSSAPVQSPNSHSSSPRSTRARWPVSWRSAPRSPGPARAATCRPRRPLQLADPLGRRLGLLRPVVGEVQPGGPAGQDLARRRGLSVTDEEDRGEGWGSVSAVAMAGLPTYCRRPWIGLPRPAVARRVPGRVLRPLRRGAGRRRSTSRCGSSRTSTTGPSPPSGSCTPSSGSTGAVLDLMSSWVSHFEQPPAGLTGARHERRRAGPQPGRPPGVVVHDLNADPHLPFDDATFDAGTCCVSVDYLVRPVEVLPRRGPGVAAGRAVRVHVLQPLLPDEGDHGAGWPTTTRAAGHRRHLLRAERRLRPGRARPPQPRRTRGDPLYAAWAARRAGDDRAMQLAAGGRRRRLPRPARDSWPGARRSPARAGGVPRRDVLGSADPRVRRPGGPHRRARPGPGGPRRQPHRPRLHRRPQRRLAVPGHAPRRTGQPADVHARRRRAAAARRVGHGGGQVRAAGQPADAGRARRLRAVPASASWRRSTRSSSCASARSASRRPAGTTAVRPRPRFGHGVEVPSTAGRCCWLVPPEPAEHVHRAADRADARRRVRPGRRARRARRVDVARVGSPATRR